jgi:tetrapyrrole (corrin/porphyrin) methylase-like protein
VCAVFYGHPGVFVTPSHEAIARARAEGFPAKMLPAVSAEDCLFADLGVDPGDAGCQSFEATDFLLHHRDFDTTVPLILWQVATIGERRGIDTPAREGLEILVGRLVERYGEDHQAVLYEASPYFVAVPRIEPLRIADVAEAKLDAITSLYVPPKEPPKPDREMFDRLGITLP